MQVFLFLLCGVFLLEIMGKGCKRKKIACSVRNFFWCKCKGKEEYQSNRSLLSCTYTAGGERKRIEIHLLLQMTVC